MTLQLGLLATMLLVQSALAWRLVATQRTLDRLQTRLANQGEALSLLTDTSENGFAAIAREHAHPAARYGRARRGVKLRDRSGGR